MSQNKWISVTQIRWGTQCVVFLWIQMVFLHSNIWVTISKNNFLQKNVESFNIRVFLLLTNLSLWITWNYFTWVLLMLKNNKTRHLIQHFTSYESKAIVLHFLQPIVLLSIPAVTLSSSEQILTNICSRARKRERETTFTPFSPSDDILTYQC